MSARYYCGLVGVAFEAPPDGACPECGRPASAHRPVAAGECGWYVECDRDHGHPCALPPGHDGPHAGPRCDRAR